MFTVKHEYNNENYHCWSVSAYFVDRNPAGSYDGSARDIGNATIDMALPEQKEPRTIYPRITLTMPDHSEYIFDVTGNVYITNESGKTIDVIRPYMERGMAKHD